MSESKHGEIPPADDAWRELLLTSLRDCGVQPAPRMVVLRYSLAILAMFFTMGVAVILSAIMGQILRGAPSEMLFAGNAILALFTVPVLARIRNRFLRHAWQSSARSAESELWRAGARRPIFYLRSFALDEQLARPTFLERYFGTRPFSTIEQQVTTLLRRLGPVIAIGRPGEKLPPLGAARFYVSDELWQRKVADVVKASQLVVWASGLTEGLGWEIAHLVQEIDPKQFVLWAHPHLMRRSPANTEAEWTKFRDKFGSIFPQPLPEKLGDARFFLFDSKWNPIPVSPRLSDSALTRQTSALKRTLLFRQDGLGEMTAEKLREQATDRDTGDFGSIIGARNAEPKWWQIAAFFLSLVIAAWGSHLVVALVSLFTDLALVDSVSWSVFSWRDHLAIPLVQTIAAVLAFRFVRQSALAVLAAAAGSTLLQLVLGGGLVSTFIEQLALFGCLTWMLRRATRLSVGVWLGVFLSFLVAGGLVGLLGPERGMTRAVAAKLATIPASATLFTLTWALLLKGVMRRTGEEEVQRGPLGQTPELSLPMKIARLIVWDIGRVLVGLVLMVAVVAYMISEEPFRRWYDTEYFHRDEFALFAVFFGVAIAGLAGGIAALARRRLSWGWTPVIALLAGLGFAALGPIGACVYWWQRESTLWAQLQANPKSFDVYDRVPGPWKRPEAYPLWIQAIERELTGEDRPHYSNLPGPEALLAELEAYEASHPAAQPALQPLQKRARELRIMKEGSDYIHHKSNNLEYYRLWLELFSRPDVPTKERAQNLVWEIESHHENEPEIAALKPKFRALILAGKSGSPKP